MGGRKLYFLVEADMHRFAPWIGRDKFFDLLRKRSLLVIRRRKHVVTTQSMGSVHQYGDHFNGKQWDCPHQAWVNDITYIRIEDKFMYLFLCTDAFSRKIIGYQLAISLEARWAVVVIKKAIRQCKDTIGVIHHSDRGFQYDSKEYVGLLKKNGIIISMGQVGYCYDNAMAERVNGILKDEYLLDQTFKNERLAGLAVDHAVKAYNEKRPHWSLNLKMPENVHQETKPNLSTNKCG